MPAPKSRYIPALDGLRAFAVMSVIFYHLGFGWAQGGLLGVTVFFVLSGYLITGLLVHEWDSTHRIDLKNFWLRRARRLLPAIIFLIVVVAALCAIFNHELLTKMRPDVPASLFFYSNWWYIFHDMSYFEMLGSPSPLTHFWSLAIEEQFYLVWPPLLFFLFSRGTKKKTLRRAALVLAAISALAMALLYNPGTDPSRVYYGTDTRAFSLLIGAWLAFVWPSNKLSDRSGMKMSPAMRAGLDICGIAAFAGLVALVALANGFTPFFYRGGTLLVTVLTAIVIAVLVHPRSIFAKAAGLPPLVWIGKRSYSMYLWHWPVILLMNPRNFTGDLGIWYDILQIGVIFAIAAFSYRFIENPIRKGAIGKFFKGITDGSISLPRYLQTHLIPVAAAAVIVVVGVGGFIAIPPTAGINNLEALEQQAQANTPPPIPVAAEGEEQFTYDIILIGDSVSVRAIPYFQAAFPGGLIDSAVSRPLSDGVWIYNSYAEQGVVGNTVVFALGTNGPANDEQLDELIGAVGSEKQIYLINTRSPQDWVQTTNDALARAADRYENVHLINWFDASAWHDEYFDGDGTHLNEEGAAFYTEMIRQATGFPTAEEVAAQAQQEQETQERLESAKAKAVELKDHVATAIQQMLPGFKELAKPAVQQ